MCEKDNILFIDFSQKGKYVRNNELFKDGSHLNAIGADEFTKDLTKELEEIYNNKLSI